MERLPSELIEEILDLHAQGLSERAIAARLEISRSAVWYHVQKDKNAVPA